MWFVIHAYEYSNKPLLPLLVIHLEVTSNPIFKFFQQVDSPLQVLLTFRTPFPVPISKCFGNIPVCTHVSSYFWNSHKLFHKHICGAPGLSFMSMILYLNQMILNFVLYIQETFVHSNLLCTSFYMKYILSADEINQLLRKSIGPVCNAEQSSGKGCESTALQEMTED